MAQVPQQAVKVFRQQFVLPSKTMLRWWPNHMDRGVLQIHHQLKKIDCVIEMHDARIPFSGRNPNFKEIIAMKPHILVLNKMDLIPKKMIEPIKEKLNEQGIDRVLFTNCKDERSDVIHRQIIPMVMDAIEYSPKFNREIVPERNLMVIGVPNIGKSAFINLFRRAHTTLHGKAAREGPIAGVTRAVQGRIRVSHNPNLFVIDTPGILTPSIPDVETGMKLSLCGCLNDSFVGYDNIVDYFLYWMNKYGYTSYVKHFSLKDTMEDKMVFLATIAANNNKIIKRKSIQTGQYVMMPNFDAAAPIVLKAFREKKLGQFMLDQDQISDKLQLHKERGLKLKKEWRSDKFNNEHKFTLKMKKDLKSDSFT